MLKKKAKSQQEKHKYLIVKAKMFLDNDSANQDDIISFES